MESLFHTGFTNYMGSIKNISVKSVEVRVTGDAGLLKSIFKSGDTPME